MRRSLLTALACGLALAALAALGAYYVNRPTVLRVAVARDTDDHKLVFVMAHALSSARRSVRLRIAPVDGANAAAAALDAGETDLAVARSDHALPQTGQTIVILHRNAAVLLAGAQSKIASVADLAGKTVGYLKGAQAGRLIDTLLGQYDLPQTARTTPLSREELARALGAGRADAVLLVGPVASGAMAEMVAGVGQGGGATFDAVFIPIAEAKAIAQRLPAVEPLEVLRGAFGGNPPRPAAAFETVQASVRLMARESLSNAVAADLARAIFAERAAMTKLAPLASQIEAPSTDKDAALPVHAGAAAYYDNEEESFFDRYSDVVYLTAMLASVVGSALAALASRMTAVGHSELDALLERLLKVLRDARMAERPEDLDALERETDDILVAGMANRAITAVDAHGMAALSVALDQARHAVRDRRAHLSARSESASAAPRV